MKNQSLKKLRLITNNTFRQVLVSFFGVVIPFLVIHFSRKEIWGDFVSVFLFCLLALQIINWGNKEYLLRKFSRKPSEIAAVFSENMATRFPLVFLFALIGLFLFPLPFAVWILLWLFGRYLNHSVEALLLYEKKFSPSMWIEIGAFLIFGLAFYFLKSELNTYSLLICFSMYQLLKGLLYFMLFRNYFSWQDAKIKTDYFQASFSFFLLSVMGFLVSRVDVYIIEGFGNQIITADYQILNNLLVFIMSVSAFVYAPFTKMIYRNTDDVLVKSQKTLALLGLIIVPVALIAIYAINLWLLKTELPIIFYGVAFLYVYPSYVYGLDIVNLFRQHQEKTVVITLLIGVLVNAVLSSSLLHFNYGITGALFGSAIAQLTVMVVFKVYKSNLKPIHVDD